MKQANVKSNKFCAFCKYWYDPTNAAIAPKNVLANIWQFDDAVWNICKRYGSKRRAGMACQKYEKKDL